MRQHPDRIWVQFGTAPADEQDDGPWRIRKWQSSTFEGGIEYVHAPPAPADTEIREALKKAEAALLPLSNAVYNDNGDMTISVPLLSSDQCVTAYFVVKAIRAALDGGKHG